MAYLDLELDLPRLVILTASTPRRNAISEVSALERQVVQLAGRDGRWSIGGSKSIRIMLAWVFGLELPNALADPRLEALRRYAVRFRLEGERLPHEEDERLVRLGFSTAALAEIRRLVVGGRRRVEAGAAEYRTCTGSRSISHAPARAARVSARWIASI
jgi:hypothetical protein